MPSKSKCSAWGACVRKIMKENPNLSIGEAAKKAKGVYNKKTGTCQKKYIRHPKRCKDNGYNGYLIPYSKKSAITALAKQRALRAKRGKDQHCHMCGIQTCYGGCMRPRVRRIPKGRGGVGKEHAEFGKEQSTAQPPSRTPYRECLAKVSEKLGPGRRGEDIRKAAKYNKCTWGCDFDFAGVKENLIPGKERKAQLELLTKDQLIRSKEARDYYKQFGTDRKKVMENSLRKMTKSQILTHLTPLAIECQPQNCRAY